MIISHKHKYIFLKTAKTAGTSIEIALSRYCGDEDIITPISPKDEAIRKKLKYRGPQNYAAPIVDYGFKDIFKLLLMQKKKRRFYNHMSAEEVKYCIDKNMWKNYFKFCFERNPWDKLISWYYWCFRSKPKQSISEFLRSNMPGDLINKGFDLYTIDGEIAVDKIFFYENMQEELNKLQNQFGFPEELVLPRAKSSFRKDKRNYREILNNEQQEQIKKLFIKEINLWGYEF